MLKLSCGIVSGILFLVLGSALSMAEAALPKVGLREAFPALTVDRPMWLAQAPDGTDRVFIVEQRGRVCLALRFIPASRRTVFSTFITASKIPDAV
jgi:hypothetical protein